MKVLTKRFFALLLCLAMMIPLLMGTVVFAETPSSKTVKSENVNTASDGLFISRTLNESDDGYSLTIEAYSKGNNWAAETGSEPLDLILLLDADIAVLNDIDGSTDSYKALSEKGYSYEDIVSGYYYYYTGSSYEPVKRVTNAEKTLYGIGYGDAKLDPKSNILAESDSSSKVKFTGVFYIKENTKVQKMKDAVCNLVDKLYEDSKKYGTDHRVTVIKYAGENYNTVGNNINYNSGNDYNYTQKIVSPSIVSQYKDSIKSAVNSIVPCGERHSENALELANSLLSNELKDSQRKKVVVLITTGKPVENSASTANADKANNLATTIKSSDNTYIYAYGLGNSEGFFDFLGGISSNTAAKNTYSKVITDYSTISTNLNNDIKSEYEITTLSEAKSRVEDELGQYFKYCTDTSAYSVKVADRLTDSEGWGSASPASSVEVKFGNDDRNVTIKGFDFTANSVYKNSDNKWQGKKIIITLKILPVGNPDVVSSVDTSKKSLIYVKGNTLVNSDDLKTSSYNVNYSWTGDYPDGLPKLTQGETYFATQNYTVGYTPTSPQYKNDKWGNKIKEYTFKGFSSTGGTFGLSNIDVTGEWSSTDIENPTHSVSYTWTGDVPQIKNCVFETPTDSARYYHNQPFAVKPFTVNGEDSSKTVYVVYDENNKYKTTTYTFSGWKLDGTVITEGVMSNTDITLTGDWTKKVTIADHYRVRYSWSGENIPTILITPTDFVTDTDFYIDKEYTSSYEFQQKDEYGNVIGKYKFSGWKLNGTGNVIDPNTRFNPGVTLSEETPISLSGTWTYEKVEPTKYSVTYKWGGTKVPSENTPTDTKKYVNNEPYNVDTTYTKGKIVYEKDSKGNVTGTYTFNGWNTASGKIAGKNVEVTGTWTYAAASNEKFRIIFEAGDYGKIDGSSSSISKKYVKYSAFPEAPEVDENKGYVFVGWTDVFGQFYEDEDDFPQYVTKDVTLTAQYKKSGGKYVNKIAYQVDYYLENSKGKYELKKTVFPLYAEEDTKVTAEVLEFDGYALNSTKSDKTGYTYLEPGKNEEEDPEFLVLELYYDEADYTITFKAGSNGKINDATTDVKTSANYGDKFPTAPTTKANSGYEFSYWKDEKGNKVTSLPTKVTESKTYTAVWETEKKNPNTGAEGTYVIGIMFAAAMLAYITGKKKEY